MSFQFQILHKDKYSLARAGQITINGQTIQTPVFMPVGTQATVKTLTPQDLELIGAQIILANTYHLYLRPGADLVSKMGGLHNFVNWRKPILTDSGGFQVFSLGYAIEHQVGKIANIFPYEKGGVLNRPQIKNEISVQYLKTNNRGLVLKTKQTLPVIDPKLVKVEEDGVVFTSHLDGSKHKFDAVISITTQHKLGAEIILAFDECPSPLHDYEYTFNSLERTHRWELESLKTHLNLESRKKPVNLNANLDNFPYPSPQYIFGIPHGGPFEDLRVKSARFLADLDFKGFSIGGSLGNTKKDMHKVLEWQIPILGNERPRHLLGIGDIDDLFECISRGIDMFDCVAPTRLARNGALFISPQNGGNLSNKFRLIITNSEFIEDSKPIDSTCSCYTCQNFSKAYIRHLFMARELLGHRLATVHNVYFIVNLVNSIRESILNNQFQNLYKKWLG